MSHQGGSSSGSPYNSQGGQDGRYFPPIHPPIPTPQVSPTKQPPMIPADHRHYTHGGGAGMPSAPSSQASERSPSADRSTRGIGVHALIHHQPTDSHEPRGQRRSAAQMESPSPVDSASGLSLPPISRPNSREYGEEDWSTPGPPRRILSPRSPRLNRTRSLNILGPPTGSIDAHQQPFLTNTSSRAYTSEPGVANTSTPHSGPPNAIRSGYYASAPTPPPQMLLSGSHRRTSGNMVPSGSVSPSTTYSSIAQAGQSPLTPLIQPTSSTPIHTPGQTPPNMHIGLAHPSGPGSMSLPGPAHPMDDGPMVGIPVVSSGQSNYQIITYATKHGQVTIPVDVQAASRVADEKRKRNAGASARFRARRKEKEREASAMISKLEQEVRDANDDVEFYRRERDALAELLFNTPGGRSHFPRPQSPRRRRPSTSSSVHNAPSTTDSSVSNSGQGSGHGDHGERSENDRNVRRRTSSYIPSITSAGSNQPPGAPTPIHGAPSSSMTALGQVPPPMPNHDEHGRPQHGLPPAQPSPQRPGAQTPFLERFDRSWPGPANGRDHHRQNQ